MASDRDRSSCRHQQQRQRCWPKHLWAAWALLAAAAAPLAGAARPLQAGCTVAAGPRRELLATADQIGGPYPVRFFALGDWGKNSSSQAAVARALDCYAQSFRPEFVISTGDIFYPYGLQSTDDRRFVDTFTSMYTGAGLQSVPWYATMGNHDYGNGCNAKSCTSNPAYQLGSLPGSDPRWHGKRGSLKTAAGGGLALFFLDTSPLISSYKKYEWASLPGGITSQSKDAVLSQLDAALGAAAGADWRVVIGHHPPRSSGVHGSYKDMISLVEPLLLKHDVQVYLSGHDHDMEHIAVQPSPTGGTYDIFVTGAGASTRPFKKGPLPGTQFRSADSGFAAVEVTAEGVTVDFRNLDGSIYTATVGRRP